MSKKQGVLKWLFCAALPKGLIFLLTFPLVVLMRVIRPFIEIRFIPVPERIGHAIGNIDVYLMERRAGLSPCKTVDIFYPDRPWKCNRQMVKMWKKLIPLHDLVYWIVWANWRNPLLAKYSHDSPNPDRDVYGLSNNTPPLVSFTGKEEDRGAALQRQMGIVPGSRIVCFHARDSAYLKTLRPEINWEYHNYRDTDIDTYVPAIKELVARGYYCIRMGRVAEKDFSWKHPQVIDYATSSWRSDFADIYLVSRCHFYIGNSCGVDDIARFFRKPQVVLNMIRMSGVSAWSPNYFNIFKKLWLIKEKRFLKFREIINSELGNLEKKDYKEYGIEIVDNTPEEIFDAIIEKEESMRGCWQTNDEYEELQRRFWGLYKPDRFNRVFKARVGSKFLLQNKELLND